MVIKLENMCYKLADYFIDQINNNQEYQKYPLSNKRLQKLMYYALVKYAYENNGSKLFKEKFCAWQHGPVVNNIYYAYSGYQKGVMEPVYSPMLIISDKKVSRVLDDVLVATKNVCTNELIRRTHIKGGPWDKVYDKKKINTIPFDSIKAYYCGNEAHYEELFPKENNVEDVRESSNKDDNKKRTKRKN